LDWSAVATAMIPGWVLAPLRLFLGVTFIYAGIQKLTDPQFFNPHATGYIGKQLQAFAVGSPLHGLLLSVVIPHAAFWGAVIAWGEIAIGLGALVGFLSRPAAFFGMLLSLTFFLTASWRVRPYFYGADIVFIFAWLTLLLAGPAAGALPALDPNVLAWLRLRLLPYIPEAQRAWVAQVMAMILGAPLAKGAPQEAPATHEPVAPTGRGKPSARAAQRQRYAQAATTRRDFLKGAVVGGGIMLVAAWLWNLTHPGATSSADTSSGNSAATSTATSSSSNAGGSNVIAQVADVPENSAVTFTIPSSGDPGVLTHLSTGNFVAFDALCTHAGCTVQYDSSSKLLFCPCHGAAFDPAQGAAVIQGPAPTPLTAVSISVNQSTGDITLS
jgi:thiosulfate dehydrogenase [quinone] large subunit